MKRTLTIMLASVALAAVASMPVPAAAGDATAAATYADIEATLGGVPPFFKMFPEAGVAGAWSEFKGIQLNPNTELSGKAKELIGLAVAAQIPCAYCVYFHTAAAKLNGATDEEIKEAVAMSAIVRHWSAVLNGMQVDLPEFKAGTDQLMTLARDRMKASGEAQSQ